MTIRAILFDVGGPIDTEIKHEQFVDQYLLRALATVGIEPSEAEFAAASEWAVQCYAPNTYLAVIFRLCSERMDVARAAERAFQESSPERRSQRGGLELRPGIGAVLKQLHGRGLLLGLAANQPADVIAELDRFGIGRYFSHREVTGHHGFHKPDVRLFLRACEDLGVVPEECIMVGDRIDNDIFPARSLGMSTVLFRTGRHIGQRPRSLNEVPDEEVFSVEGLAAAVERLTGRR